MSQLASVGEQEIKLAPRRVLIAGSGPDDVHGLAFRAKWAKEDYHSVTLDIDPRNEPDICASMTNMGDIGKYDVVYCCHALEHLYPHEVHQTLSEFARVLVAGGTVFIMVPDLEGVSPTEDILNAPTMGPITGLHLFYGDATQIKQFPYMAHHCGFVQKTLEKVMKSVGLADVSVRRAAEYNLIGTGVKV